jgi:TM2 domain-containing membrane protein YozV
LKKSTKAVLLSGLVFPGLGHLYLKRWVTGVVLSGVAAFAIYYISSIAMTIALDVSRKIETGAIPADIVTVTNVVSQQFSGMEQATNLASITLLVCWVTGIVGSYWQGRSQDKLDASGQLRVTNS